MISESDVERKRDARLAQLAVQLDRVDEVAVVGERDLAPVGAPDGLRVLPRVRAGGRVADVADRHVALQRAQLLLVEHLVDEALVAHGHDVAALGGGDARRLLPAVLERVEREVGEAGDVVRRARRRRRRRTRRAGRRGVDQDGFGVIELTGRAGAEVRMAQPSNGPGVIRGVERPS